MRMGAVSGSCGDGSFVQSIPFREMCSLNRVDGSDWLWKLLWNVVVVKTQLLDVFANTICCIIFAATFQTLAAAGRRRLRLHIECDVRPNAVSNKQVWNAFFIIYIICSSIACVVFVTISIVRAVTVVVIVVVVFSHPWRRKHCILSIRICDFTFRRRRWCQHTCRLAEFRQCIGRLNVFMRSG